MKKLSKIFMAIALVFVIPFVLVACGNGNNPKPPVDNSIVKLAIDYDGPYDSYEVYRYEDEDDAFDAVKDDLWHFADCNYGISLSIYEIAEEDVRLDECVGYSFSVPADCIDDENYTIANCVSDYIQQYEEDDNWLNVADMYYIYHNGRQWEDAVAVDVDNSAVVYEYGMYFTQYDDFDVVVTIEYNSVDEEIYIGVYSFESDAFEEMLAYQDKR